MMLAFILLGALTLVGGVATVAARNAVQLAFCWSHVRRRFYELAQAGPAPIASEVLARLAEHMDLDEPMIDLVREVRAAG